MRQYLFKTILKFGNPILILTSQRVVLPKNINLKQAEKKEMKTDKKNKIHHRQFYILFKIKIKVYMIHFGIGPFNTK